MRIIDESLLDLFRGRGRCEWCGHACHRQPHHIWAKGLGGGSRLDIRVNLIGLCWECHSLTHNGKIKRAALLLIVAKREGTTVAKITNEIHRLRRKR